MPFEPQVSWPETPPPATEPEEPKGDNLVEVVAVVLGASSSAATGNALSLSDRLTGVSRAAVR